MGGRWVGEKKTKLMLYSTLVEVKVEVGVELGKMVQCSIPPMVATSFSRSNYVKFKV